MLQDLRFAARQMSRSPVATAVAILTLTIAIGATTAIGSVVHAVLLRPLPWSQPDRLVNVWDTYPHWRSREILSNFWDRIGLDWPEFSRLRETTMTLDRVAAYAARPVTVSAGGEPEIVLGGVATHELLDVLGARVAHGRWFTPDEDQTGAPAVVVIGHALWTTRLGADPTALGRAIRVDGDAYTVVGVLPPGFAFGRARDTEPAAIWTPLGRLPEDMRGQGDHSYQAIARLADGVTAAQALDEITPILRGDRSPDEFGVRLVPRLEEVIGDSRPGMLLLLAAVGLVLVAAVVNIANLKLSQAARRDAEIAVRRALGAGRARLTRLLVVESLLLGVLGGIGGWVLALVGTGALVTILPADVPRLETVQVHGPALAFAVAVSVAASLIFGLVPALRSTSRRGAADPLRAGARSTSDQRLQRALIAVEVALAIVLLIGGGLLTRSLGNVLSVDPGFRAEGVLAFDVAPPPWRYDSPERVDAFFSTLGEAIDGLPGVTGAAWTSELPLGGRAASTSLRIPSLGMTPDGPSVEGERRVVSPGFFGVMGIPLVRGRLIDATDTAAAQRVVVVSRAAVERLWGGRDPIGDEIVASRQSWTVVGVAGDVRHRGLDVESESTIYYPLAQYPRSRLTGVVRTALDPAEVAPGVRETARQIDPELPLTNVRTVTEVVRTASSEQRHRALLLGGFALVVLALACVGIYGVTAHVVATRTRELGIRVALGADRRRILRLVLMDLVGRMTAAGALAGLATALAAGSAIERFLYGVEAHDPATYLVVAVGVVGLTLAAAWAPARWASRVPPAIALRTD